MPAAADKQRALYLAGNRDLRAHYDRRIADATAAEQAALEAQRQAEAEAALAAARRDKHRLKALLAANVGHLGRRGKPAARDARDISCRHVEDAFPGSAARPATAITAADLRSVLARLVQSSVRVETLSTAVAELSTTLLAGKDITAPFRLSDIRRTAETLLAGLGV